MFQRIALVGFTLVLLAQISVLAAADEFRTWQDKSGKFQLKAKFVSEKDGIVFLQRDNGKSMRIKLELLSAADQAHIESLKKAQESPFKKKDDSDNPFKKKMEPDNPFKKKAESDSPFKVKPKSDSDSPFTIKSNPSPPADEPDFDETKLSASDKAANAFLKTDNIIQKAKPPRSWRIRPDAIEFPEASPNGTIALPPATESESVKNLVSNATGSHAALAYTSIREDKTRIALVDLHRQRVLSTGVTFDQWDIISLSNDAKMVLLRNEDSEGRTNLRVCAFNGMGIAEVVTWVPYTTKTKYIDTVVRWASFAGRNQVATLSTSGQMVFWSLPDGKPTSWMYLKKPATPVVSASGKYLFCSSDSQLGVFYTNSKRIVGMTKLQGLGGFVRTPPVLSVSPTGRRLAIINTDYVHIHDLADGKLIQSIWVGDFDGRSTTAAWADDRHLVLNGHTVFDVQTKMHLWEYSGATRAVGADGNCWFFKPGDAGSVSPQLVAQAVPNLDAIRARQDVISSGDYFLFVPGEKVAVDVSGIPEELKRDEIETKAKTQLKELGYTIDDSADLKVVMALKKNGTEEFKVRIFGLSQDDKTYSFTSHTSTKNFLYKDEPVLKTGATTYKPGFIRLEQGQTVESYLQSRPEIDYGVFDIKTVPTHIPRPRNGSYLLGKTEI